MKFVVCGASLTALLFVIAAPSAHAFKKFAEAEGKPCAYCHVNPAGGGPRNYRGLFYKVNGLSFKGFDDAAEAKKAGAEIGPAATPPPKSLAAAAAAVSTPPALPPSTANAAAVPDFGEANFGGVVFIKIPAGSYRRGTTDAQKKELEETGAWTPMNAVEQPAREVRITRPFFISKHEITQEQWARVMGSDPRTNPSAFKGPDLPVDSVSWNEAQAFKKTFAEKMNDGGRYRLPTEAEWEYAARAGGDGIYGLGADKQPITREKLPEYAWHSVNAQNKTQAVGKKKPNAWGLHDMLGNVWEWCEDAYLPDFYATGPATAPLAQSPEATERVFRGGCWFLDTRAQRASLRGGHLPTFKSQYVGLRLVREL